MNKFATFLFLALVNKPKRQHLTAAQANEGLVRTIQEITGSAENVLFWSNNQKLLLDEEDSKLLQFSSEYGTGKYLSAGASHKE